MTSPLAPGALPEHISLATIIPAIERALAEGRLAAQQRPELKLTCLYSYPDELGLPPGCGCAIGVGLSPEARALLRDQKENAEYIHTPNIQKIISCPKEELNEISFIQRQHDNVLQLGLPLRQFIEAVAVIARAHSIPFAPPGASASEPQS